MAVWSKKIVLSLISGSIQGVLGLGTAWLLKRMVDIVTECKTELAFQEFILIVIAYYLLYMAFYLLSKRIKATAMQELRTAIKKKLSGGLIWQTTDQHEKSQIGDVISRFEYQVDNLENVYYEPLFSLIRTSVVIIISLGASIYLQWQITLLSLLIFVLFMALSKGLQDKLNDYQNKTMRASEEENRAMETMVSGFYTAKDFGEENYFLNKYRQSAEEFADADFRYVFLSDMISVIATHIEAVITLLILIVGGLMYYSRTAGVTLGGILGITQLLASILNPITTLGPTISQIKSSKVIRDVFSEYETAGIIGKETWTNKGRELPELDKISFRGVSFSYHNDASDDGVTVKKDILKNINIDLCAHQKYALVGESGSGKTTFLKLVLKQLVTTTGTISWNDVPYAEIGLAGLLPQIAYVAQIPVIFNKNIKTNILAGSPEDQEKLMDVLEKSELISIREGLDVNQILHLPAQVLSGGEKKRLALARALYRGGDILILDEFTSSVQEEMAEELERELLQNNKQLILHVTHSLHEKNVALYHAIFTIHNQHLRVGNG